MLTKRLRYIAQHILSDMLALEVQFTSNRDVFIAHDGAKINYSSCQFADELFFYPATLLFEKGIKTQQIKVTWYRGMPIFYRHQNNSDLPFDIFAASFFLLSRYEEYLPHTRDAHDRYPAEESLAHRDNFLHLPVIDHWVIWLSDVLLRRYPNLPISRKRYKFIATYDIDIAYAYRHKGILRNLGGSLQSLRHPNAKAQLSERIRVLAGIDPDPYDTYQWQFDLQQQYQFRANYFFLVGEYGIFDKNISANGLAYQRLIQSIADFYEVGIHPSYRAASSPNILADEMRCLADITKKEVKKSRQHYIKLNLPQTYQTLLDLGIDKDYTMGYPSQAGFRAGTASSFWFYDLSLETPTELRIFPFAVMDVTLQHYLNLSPEEATRTIEQLIAQIKAVKGVFCPIWHNHTLCNLHEWRGWREVYEQMIVSAI
ncbi:MAG: polysaccharide deacetylase family protein [Chitinophagales bacterium]|nr:polysaccharide deacetylase family protein [Chitinophagales bacterium]